MLNRKLFVLWGVLLFLTGGKLLVAQTWDGGGADNNVSTVNNWNPNAFPPNNGTANITFGGTTRLNITVDVNSDVNSITFDNTSGAFTFTGNSITVQGGGITNNDNDLQTFNSSMLLGASQTWNGGSGGLSITSAFDTNGYALNLQGNGTFSNQIYDTGSITLNTTGTWNFTGSAMNNLTAFTINAGTAVFNGSTNYYNTGGTLTIGDGSGTDTLQLGASNQIEDSKDVSLQSSGVFNLNNFNETIKALNMTGGSVTTGSGTLTLGNFGGTQLTGNASSTTATIAGNLALASYSTTFDIADGSAASDVLISAAISGSNNRFIKTGNGTLVLSGTNTFSDTGNSWDQAITIQGGTVQVSADNNLGNSGNNISLQGGTLKVVGTFSSGSNRDIKVDAGSGTIEVSAGNTFTHTGIITGSNTLTKTGAGTFTLNNSGTDQMAPGAINISAGTLLLGSSNQIANSTNMTLSGGTFATGGNSETLGTLTLSASSVINLGSGSSILKFADSSGTSWASGAILSVWNWSGTGFTGGGTDQLWFGTGSSGLTSTQLSQIQFYSDNGTTLLGSGVYAIPVTGEVTVPEAKVWWSALLLVLLVFGKERQRLRNLFPVFKLGHGQSSL